MRRWLCQDDNLDLIEGNVVLNQQISIVAKLWSLQRSMMLRTIVPVYSGANQPKCATKQHSCNSGFFGCC